MERKDKDSVVQLLEAEVRVCVCAPLLCVESVPNMDTCVWVL